MPSSSIRRDALGYSGLGQTETDCVKVHTLGPKVGFIAAAVDSLATVADADADADADAGVAAG